jgi:hypothetical protein
MKGEVINIVFRGLSVNYDREMGKGCNINILYI